MMDCDWKCLIDEMWESYLCEENIADSSFYESTSTEPFSNVEDDHFGLDDSLISWSNHAVDEHVLLGCQDWVPFQNLFSMMEEVTLFSETKEKQGEKSVPTTKDLQSEKIKSTTKQKKAKSTKDAETNTQKIPKVLKSKSTKTRKRKSNTKSSNHSPKKQKE